MMNTPELLWDVRAELGEGPVWDAARACVWFVDIKGRKLHRYNVEGGARASWDTPDQTGFALPAVDGSLICGVRGGLHRFDPATGRFELLLIGRSEERRVGKECSAVCRSRWSPGDRKSTRLNSSHSAVSRMPSSA